MCQFETASVKNYCIWLSLCSWSLAWGLIQTASVLRESDWSFKDKAFRMHGIGSPKNFLPHGSPTVGEAVMNNLWSQ